MSIASLNMTLGNEIKFNMLKNDAQSVCIVLWYSKCQPIFVYLKKHSLVLCHCINTSVSFFSLLVRRNIPNKFVMFYAQLHFIPVYFSKFIFHSLILDIHIYAQHSTNLLLNAFRHCCLWDPERKNIPATIQRLKTIHKM